MLEVRGLCKRFYGHEVLAQVDLSIRPGEVVGLIGRSGAGKSTLARCLVGLEAPNSGEIRLDGALVTPGSGQARRRIQYLWQDPTQSLSPFLGALDTVRETLNGFALGPAATRAARAGDILNDLGVEGAMKHRRPHSLSGGQCQRIALARALAAEPDVLILDEPLSSLDLATQVSTIRLLRRVHRATSLAMLIVSHDLAPLRQLADRILVLDDARIIEDIPMPDFAARATHPLSRAYAETLDPAR